jgi:hypothetical protein
MIVFITLGACAKSETVAIQTKTKTFLLTQKDWEYVKEEIEQQLITGKIEKRKNPFAHYIPIVQNPFSESSSWLSNAIQADGSIHNQEINFKNVKKV